MSGKRVHGAGCCQQRQRVYQAAGTLYSNKQGMGYLEPVSTKKLVQEKYKFSCSFSTSHFFPSYPELQFISSKPDPSIL